jgi:hypothetical protein
LNGSRLIAFAERSLHQHCVDPLAQLEADGLEGADDTESQPEMKCDGAGIAAIADDRQHLPPRSLFAAGDEFPEQRSANALAVEGEFGSMLSKKDSQGVVFRAQAAKEFLYHHLARKNDSRTARSRNWILSDHGIICLQIDWAPTTLSATPHRRVAHRSLSQSGQGLKPLHQPMLPARHLTPESQPARRAVPRRSSAGGFQARPLAARRGTRHGRHPKPATEPDSCITRHGAELAQLTI